MTPALRCCLVAQALSCAMCPALLVVVNGQWAHFIVAGAEDLTGAGVCCLMLVCGCLKLVRGCLKLVV